MAAIEAATQQRASARAKDTLAAAYAAWLGGRVKPGHDEVEKTPRLRVKPFFFEVP